MLKVCNVNCSTGLITINGLSHGLKGFGGRGIIAKIMNAEVDPKCEPLGAENKLIIAGTLLSGTGVPTCNRLSVGGKSPLTETIKESNVGGVAGGMLADHGIRTLIIEDLPKETAWKILRIKANGEVILENGDDVAGNNTYRAVELLKERYGSKIGIMVIGMAGERGYKNSSIQVNDVITGNPSRAAARGGMGAVMGSKKLKAIVIEPALKKSKPVYKDEVAFEEARRDFIKVLKEYPLTGKEGLQKKGTSIFMDFTGSFGILPVNNFSGKKFERLKEIDSNSFVEAVNRNNGKIGIPCQPGCTIRCSNIYNDKDGNMISSGIEYETIALIGPNCGISDWDTIAKFDHICDDLGVDTMETGASIGVAMDAGKIPWGDKEAALGLVMEMVNGTDFGRIMGAGTKAVGEALKAKRVPTVKGQALAAYDPRNLKGTAVSMCTSAMGADHTTGPTGGAPVDPTKKEGQIELSKERQKGFAFCDNSMCLYAWVVMQKPDNMSIPARLLTAYYGDEWTPERMLRVGAETISLEWDFNKRAGFSSKDDRMPDFFYTEKSEVTGAVFDFSEDELQAVKRLDT